MQATGCKLSRTAALLIAVITVFANVAWASQWKVGDVIVCFGDGTCQVVRPVPAPLIVLDTIGDGTTFTVPGPITTPGDTFGVAINNTLHVLVTDAGGGTNANVVEYQIAGTDPLGNLVKHGVATVFNNSGVGDIQAVALDSAGDMFILNANGGSPQIVKLNQSGTTQSTIQLNYPANHCNMTQVASVDLSADGSSAYVTSGGTIQKVTLSNGSCSLFANFGPNVTLNGIKDIPPNALPATCGSSVPPAVPCPTDETILVTAIGNTDPDGSESEAGSPDPDAVNICTNQQNSAAVSCALLLDTNPNPGLNSPLWQAGNQYFNLNAPILDPSLHLQTVSSAGTSGGDEPNFNDAVVGKTIDNAVQWTDIRQPARSNDTMYATLGTAPAPGTAAVAGTFFVDPNGNLETVTAAGTSGHYAPGFTGNPSLNNPVSWSTTGSTTIDGLQWQDQGFWQPNTPFAIGAAVGDAAGHPHVVLTAGKSGAGPSTPAGGWNDSGSTTIDNAVIWMNQGDVVAYSPNHPFTSVAPPNIYVVEGGHVQQRSEPGTSGTSTPPFSITGGSTQDGGVTWTDQGLRPWHPVFAFASGAVIVDGLGHLQAATKAGTSGPSQPTFNDAGSTTTDGLQWTDQGAPATWASGPLLLNEFILDNSTPAHVQQVVLAGTSGGSEPASFSTNGGYTLDGSVVWLDRGVATYQGTHAYNAGDAFSDGTDIQQATSAGTSSASQPVFAEIPTTVTADNAVVWQDETALAWQPNFSYDDSTPAKTYVIDGAHHVQQATTTGTSGPGAPTFVDGGLTMLDDTVTWQDLGLRFWHPGTYALNAVIRDAAGHLQAVTGAGTSGPTQPTFNDSGSTTTDGLQWNDQGLPATWAATSPFSAGQFIVDNSVPNAHVQQAVVAGSTSGTEGPFSTSGGYTLDGSVVWLDRGVAAYQPNNSYSVGSAFFDGKDIQQALAAGTAGGSAPTFTDTPPAVTADNAVVWQDETALAWQGSFNYTATTPATTFIIDPTNHVQEVTIAGMSGGSAPTFNDGGMVYDGLLWQDIGSLTTWTPNSTFTVGQFVADPNFLQEVISSGVSGPGPLMPAGGWNEIVGGNTPDGLQWTDGGHSIWISTHLFSSPGFLISETTSPYHAQAVYEAGTSGPGPNPPAFNHILGLTPDNVVTWAESHPSRGANQAYVQGAIVLDTNLPIPHVQQVSSAYTYGAVHTGGTTGPLPNPFAFNDGGMTVIDGLQWTNAPNPATSVVARYPVTGLTTLQALALNPLIRNCTSSCSPVPSPQTAGFWIADSMSGDFFNVAFSSGTAQEYTAPFPSPCTGCRGIEGIAIYGGEGAAQPDLAQLPPATLTTSSTTTTNSPVFNFNPNPSYNPPHNPNDNSSITITGYNFPTNPNLLLTAYASAINPASGVSDNPLITLAPPPNPPKMAPSAPCTVMTHDGNCVIWQLDHNDLSGAPCTTNTCEYLWVDFSVPSGADPNNIIDVIEEQYNDTYSLDGAPKRGSQLSLHTITPTIQGAGNCTYGSPLAPTITSPPVDFSSSKGNITFKFSCANLPSGKTQANLLPFLYIVQFTTGPLFSGTEEPFLFLQGTGGTVNYRYDSTSQQWVFNLQNPMFGFTPKAKRANYQACTEDANHIVETFCTNFYVQ